MDIRIKPLEWEERKTRLGTVWWSAPNPLGGLSIEAASESDKIAAQADYERRIRSALEPAAPEGQQPVGVVWFGYDENTGEFTGESCSVEPHDSHRFRAYAPITARPAEQAVTEALKRIRDYADKPHADRYVIRNMAEDALKAAMEAGRHD